jgi:V8-like Glu-specific endopeptidase
MTIFGPDNRTQVPNTSTGINAAIVHITATFRDGTTGMATGALLDSTHVLTAGHVVFDQSDGGWAKSVTVTPGEQGMATPLGSYQAAQLATTQGWALTQNPGSDYAIVTLSKPVTGVSTFFHLDAATTQQLLGTTVTTAGYPGDKGSAFPTSDQFQETGTIAQVTSTLELSQMDVYPGQSGSPVWIQDAQGDYDIVGIVDFQTSATNGFVRITQNLEQAVANWDPGVIEDNPAPAIASTFTDPLHRFPFGLG